MPRNSKRVKKELKKNFGALARNTASELNLTKLTVSRIQIKDLDMKALAELSARKYIKDQEVRVKRGCRKAYQTTLKKTLIIDDESC